MKRTWDEVVAQSEQFRKQARDESRRDPALSDMYCEAWNLLGDIAGRKPGHLLTETQAKEHLRDSMDSDDDFERKAVRLVWNFLFGSSRIAA